MSSADFSIRSNIKEIQKKLGAFAYQQVPFATAKTLTSIAKMVQKSETDNLASTFKNPSPFTLRSVRMTSARKGNLVATVFVMDKAARYLQPYEDGGVHQLSSKALLNPKDIPLNQYGQLRKGALAALKARSDVFIGPVRTRKGIVNGVWQREASAATVTRTKAGRLIVSAARKGFNKSGKLKLLIRFGDALPVNKRLGYRARAKKIIDSNINKEFGKALAQAMASAKD
jgi:hypothetical protein